MALRNGLSKVIDKLVLELLAHKELSYSIKCCPSCGNQDNKRMYVNTYQKLSKKKLCLVYFKCFECDLIISINLNVGKIRI